MSSKYTQPWKIDFENTDYLLTLQADLEETTRLLNEITAAATHYNHKMNKDPQAAFELIEKLARQARNHLDPHLWPF